MRERDRGRRFLAGGGAEGNATDIPVHRDKYYIIERYKRSTMHPSFGNEGQ